MRCFRVLPVLLLIGAAPPHRYTIDANRSEILARVAFFGLASKTARFPKVSGGITLAPDQPDRVDLDVTLDATALTAPDAITLGRLKGPKFFDVDRYPTIAFRGKTMRMTSATDAQISGQISARGVTQPA
ncbi:MAG: polyisoprenoid-binding protein, partial [Sphingomonadales bacterium]